MLLVTLQAKSSCSSAIAVERLIPQSSPPFQILAQQLLLQRRRRDLQLPQCRLLFNLLGLLKLCGDNGEPSIRKPLTRASFSHVAIIVAVKDGKDRPFAHPTVHARL